MSPAPDDPFLPVEASCSTRSNAAYPGIGDVTGDRMQRSDELTDD
jgi:hypothetical protein